MTDTIIKTCPTLEDTIIFVTDSHRGQEDKGGQQYILHVMRVTVNLGINATDPERITALLHDVVEDCYQNREEGLQALRDRGYPEDIVQAVDSVTKRPDEKGEAGYFRAIDRAAANSTGRKVKIADLEDNTLPARNIPPLSAKDQERLNKYTKAIVHLQRIELNDVKGRLHNTLTVSQN